MSGAEIRDYFRRVRDGELVVDNTHPEYGWLNIALQKYRAATIGSALAPPVVT